MLPFVVVYHGNNVIHLWIKITQLLKYTFKKDGRIAHIWQEYWFVTHLTLTQCLIERNLHWFQYSSICHLCASSEIIGELKNIGESKHFSSCLLPTNLNTNWILLIASYFTENQHDFQISYMLKLYILWGNLGGLSLTSVSVIFTVVDPDSPPTCPAISLAWMTTE